MPAWLPGLLGAIAVLIIGGVAYLGLTVPKSVAESEPEATVRRLADAVAKRDAEAAMTYIDFDRLFEDVYRRHLASRHGVDINDPSITDLYASVPAYVRTLAKNDLKNMIKREEATIGDGEVIREDPAPGTMPDLLARLAEGRVTADGSDAARLVFGGGRQYFVLARSTSDGVWRIVGFAGFEEVAAGALPEIEKSVQDYIIKDIEAQTETARAGGREVK